MIRVLWLTLSLTLVLGLAGCDMFGGGSDAGAGGGEAKKADAGAAPEAEKVDLGPLIDKLAAQDEGALEEVKKLKQEDGHQLIALLKDEDAKKRKAAAFAARAMPSEKHSEAFAAVLDAEKDAEVAKIIVETLKQAGDAKAVGVLVGAMGKDPAQAEKIAAVAALGDKLGDNKGAAEAALVKLAADGDHRLVAIETLGKWKSESAKKDIVKMAQKDKDVSVQAAALRAVGSYGDKGDLKKTVFTAYKSKKAEIQLAAIDATVAIGHKSAVPKLKKLAKKGKSKDVKAAAKKAMKSLK
jgi:HEAT repeat protein